MGKPERSPGAEALEASRAKDAIRLERALAGLPMDREARARELSRTDSSSLGSTALHLALTGAWSKSELECVRLLLSAGADPSAPDSDGWTPLHMAAAWGKPEAIGALAAAGADASKRNEDGLEPGHLAALAGEAESLRALAKEGWSAGRLDGEGFSGADHAALYGGAAALREALAAGGDPNRKSPLGKTPGQAACERGGAGRRESLEALVAAGWDFGERGADGKGAMDWARGDEEARGYLKSLLKARSEAKRMGAAAKEPRGPRRSRGM